MKKIIGIVIVLLAVVLMAGGCGRHEHWMQGNGNRGTEDRS